MEDANDSRKMRMASEKKTDDAEGSQFESEILEAEVLKIMLDVLCQEKGEMEYTLQTVSADIKEKNISERDFWVAVKRLVKKDYISVKKSSISQEENVQSELPEYTSSLDFSQYLYKESERLNFALADSLLASIIRLQEAETFVRKTTDDFTKLREQMLDLEKKTKEITGARKEVIEIRNGLQKKENSYLGELNEKVKEDVDDKLQEELKLDGQIGRAIQDMQKNIIQFMGIFVAIFALIGLNLGKADALAPEALLMVNLCLSAVIVTLMGAIGIIIHSGESKLQKIFCLAALLWIVVIVVACIIL